MARPEYVNNNDDYYKRVSDLFDELRADLIMLDPKTTVDLADRVAAKRRVDEIRNELLMHGVRPEEIDHRIYELDSDE